MWDSYFMKLKNKVATSKRFDTPLKKIRKPSWLTILKNQHFEEVKLVLIGNISYLGLQKISDRIWSIFQII